MPVREIRPEERADFERLESIAFASPLSEEDLRRRLEREPEAVCLGHFDSAGTLIANHHSVPEIASIIGADSLGYLSMEHAMQLAGDECRGFCAACFGGEYPAGKPAPGGKNRFEQRIHSK